MAERAIGGLHVRPGAAARPLAGSGLVAAPAWASGESVHSSGYTTGSVNCGLDFSDMLSGDSPKVRPERGRAAFGRLLSFEAYFGSRPKHVRKIQPEIQAASGVA